MTNEKVPKRAQEQASGESSEERMPMTLILKLYRSGNPQLKKIASEQVVSDYGNYVRDIIRSRYTTFSDKYEDDLFHCGVIGLLEALKVYDGKHAFTTCSKPYIIHELSLFVCSLQGNSSIYYAQNQKQVKNAIFELEESRQEITSERIAEMTGLSREVVAREINALVCANVVYLDDPESADILQSAGQQESVETMIEEKIMWEKLTDAIQQLDEDEKEILRRHILRKGSAGDREMSRYRERKKRDEIYDKLKRAVR